MNHTFRQTDTPLPCMHRIFKYELVLGTNPICLPCDARVLSVMVQHNRLQMWALVKTDNPTEVRTFEVYGTGAPVSGPDSLVHIGTVPAEGGRFIWHIFERRSDVSAP